MSSKIAGHPPSTRDLSVIAGRLDSAMCTATATPQLGDLLTLDDAYQIQSMSFDKRVARGERRIGMKMGFTSRAKMAQMGVDEMIWGRLSDRMIVEEGGAISRAGFVHPRAEPEIAFLMRRRLEGPVTALEASLAIEAFAPAIEIIDSRYESFRFSLTDVVADNSSSAALVVGGWLPAARDFSNLGMILSQDGRAVEIGSSAAILGHPLRSLQAASRLIAQRGEALEAGSIVLAGGATAAFALSAGSLLRLEIGILGAIQFKVEE